MMLIGLSHCSRPVADREIIPLGAIDAAPTIADHDLVAGISCRTLNANAKSVYWLLPVYMKVQRTEARIIEVSGAPLVEFGSK